MKLSYFCSYILILTLFWSEVYFKIKTEFNGTKEYQAQVAHLRKQVERSALQTRLADERLLDFQQSVATLMPRELKTHKFGPKGYMLRNLASVVTSPESENVRKIISDTLFNRGKTFFRQGNYEHATRIFKQFISRYNYSIHTPEAYFLMAESYFRTGDKENSVKTIQTMIQLFPENALTGFAMIRLGRIYETEGRGGDAVDIYKTVIRSYPQRDVASQAQASLRGLDL